jgi:hypothetical protein
MYPLMEGQSYHHGPDLKKQFITGFSRSFRGNDQIPDYEVVVFTHPD